MSGYKKQQIHDGDCTTAMPQCGQCNQPIHVNLFGPCKSSDMGDQYVVTITDAFTKYAEIVGIPKKKAEMVADTVSTKCFLYRCQAIIHTDGGKEFINKTATKLSRVHTQLQHISSATVRQRGSAKPLPNSRRMCLMKAH